MTNTNDQLYKIYQDMRDQGVLEDRREYEEGDLAKMYGLDLEHSTKLYLMIQSDFDVKYQWSKKQPQTLYDMIEDAEHQAFDGWDPGDIPVIMAFLADIANAGTSAEEGVPGSAPRYYCPCCGSKDTRVVEIDLIEGTIGDDPVPWHMVHLECTGCADPLAFTVSVVKEVLDRRDKEI